MSGCHSYGPTDHVPPAPNPQCGAWRGLEAEEHNEEQDPAPGEPGLWFYAEEAGWRFCVERFLQP